MDVAIQDWMACDAQNQSGNTLIAQEELREAASTIDWP
jgi:hypothetical protein